VVPNVCCAALAGGPEEGLGTLEALARLASSMSLAAPVSLEPKALRLLQYAARVALPAQIHSGCCGVQRWRCSRGNNSGHLR